jgi:hypothetical protein
VRSGRDPRPEAAPASKRNRDTCRSSSGGIPLEVATAMLAAPPAPAFSRATTTSTGRPSTARRRRRKGSGSAARAPAPAARATATAAVSPRARPCRLPWPRRQALNGGLRPADAHSWRGAASRREGAAGSASPGRRAA